MPVGLLRLIDDYMDAVPRSEARAEDIGQLRLFVRESRGWPYYARPIPGRRAPVTVADLEAVRRRQRELGLPEAFEWVEECAPEMAAAADEAGLEVVLHPLLVLERLRSMPARDGFRLVRVEADEGQIASCVAVAEVAFASPGTQTGEAGVEAAEEALGRVDGDLIHAIHERIREGLMVLWAVVARDGATVATGGHQPVVEATEIVGVATLPAFRRRGLGTAVTAALAADAREGGCRLVFLSAGDEATARVYEHAGFRRVGTTGAAERAG